MKCVDVDWCREESVTTISLASQKRLLEGPGRPYLVRLAAGLGFTVTCSLTLATLCF